MRNCPHAIRHLPSSILALTLLALPALAQTNIDLMLKPFAEKTPIDVNATGYVLESGHTDRPAGDNYQLSIIDLYGRYRFAPSERYDPRLGFNATFLNFDSDNPNVPDGLLDTSVAVGFGVYEDKAEGWQAGITLGIGYAGARGGPAGDDLFSDKNALYGKASILIGKHINKTDALVFVIDYDGNRTYKPDVPIPGIAYQKQIFGNPNPDKQGAFEPTLLLTLGVPFSSVHWKPMERLTVDASFLFPDNFSARVDYDLLPERKLGIFGALDTRRDAFHWNALRHGDDRLLYYQRRAEVGLRWTPARKVNLNLAAGYAFSQELTTGFDSSDDDKLTDLSDRPYLRLGLEVGF